MYLGNDLQVAFPSYRNIDDISSAFDGVTTSFPLLINGSAPVPAPLGSNQCLISVNGVVQKPDDTGSTGFRLSGGNIIFSSAPAGAAPFFGVVLAGADYVNAGANFPDGTLAAPSITFDQDNDTGYYRSGSGSVSFAANGVAAGTWSSAGVAAPALIPTGSTLPSNGVYLPGTNRVGVATNSTARLEVDSSGRLLVGTSTARTNIPGGGQGVLIEGSSSTNDQNRFTTHVFGENSTSGPYVGLAKTRSASIGGNTIVQSGDFLGGLYFHGADGTTFVPAANIVAQVDGTPGANDMPGRLVFSTTADGASSPTERMRIKNSGDFTFSNTTLLSTGTDNVANLGANGLRWAAVWAANGTIQTSDNRAKTEIADATLGSDFINSLRPVSYKWIEGGKRDTDERDEDGNWIYESVPGERTHWGFLAQEVKKAVDDAGVDFGGWVLTDKDDPDSQQALRYDQFIAPLTKALQEALTKIETLEAKVAALEAQ